MWERSRDPAAPPADTGAGEADDGLYLRVMVDAVTRMELERIQLRARAKALIAEGMALLEQLGETP